MQCFDCTTAGTQSAAVGICTICGAAVCADCVRVGHQPVRHMTVFGSADVAVTDVRLLACPSCATTLSAQHAGKYRFAEPEPAGLVPEMR